LNTIDTIYFMVV